MISVVCTGGRVNAVRPVSRVNTVYEGRNILFRASTIRTTNCIGVSIRGRGVSLLSVATRGLRKPGNYNLLCVEGNMEVRGLVYNNTRREGGHTNARGITNVINLSTTLRLTISNVSREGTGLRGVHSELVSNLLGVRHSEVGNSEIRELPNGIGVYFRNVRNRDLLLELSLGNISTSSNSTYASNDLSPDRMLLTVNLPRRVTRNDVHLSFSSSGARRSVSCVLRVIPRVISCLEDVSPL